MNKVKDRIYGCLFGGALGDSLGYPVEFYTAKHISEAGMLEKPYDLRQISDDTQMTLFTAEGLIASDNQEEVMHNILSAYKFWFGTQYFMPKFDYNYDSQLVKDRRLHARRAPGGTCIPALRADPEDVDNDSCGCGGVMRVAPVGLIFNEVDAYRIGCESARLTHKNVLGYEPAGILAAIISNIMSGEDLPAAVDKAISLCSDRKLQDILRAAANYAREDRNDIGIYNQYLGEGWSGHEALAIAVYCALKYDALALAEEEKFEKALLAAVFHDGDSDSTGAIAGNILGAYYGLSALPCCKEELECCDLIEKLGNELYEKRAALA